MERLQLNTNCFEFFETKEEKKQKQINGDKDLIIADLLIQNAEKEQRLNDLELIVADMLGGK
ncbi:hypothetical protein [Abyssisolibacter fermentans]|uniref:hypothetical protein n=1 Tax=Abyssisolibacter fermentans TaxID=1766203 RepID=UPI00083678DE|nr:hypothetical protein [Abyssisolibacter fermentans]